MKERVVFRDATWAALGLALALAPPAASAEGASVAPAAGPAVVAPPSAIAPTLYEIVGDLGRVDRLQREIAATLRETSDWSAYDAMLDEATVDPRFRILESGADAVTRVRYLELRSLDAHLRERLRAADEAVAGIGQLTQRVVSRVDRLDHEIALWPQRSTLARERGAPDEIQRRIDAVVPALGELRTQLVARRDHLLVAYERAVRLESRLESLRSSVAERRERLWASLRTSVGAPIWRPGAIGLPLEEMRADTRFAGYELVGYLQRAGHSIALVLVVVGTALFILLRRSVAAAGEMRALPPLSIGTAVCGGLTVAIVAIVVFAPAPTPFVFYRIAWFTFPLLAAFVATRTFARAIAPSAWALAFAVFLNEFRALAEMSPAIDWALLALQVAPFGAALLFDWRRGALQPFLGWRPVVLRRALAVEITVLVGAVVANLVGYVGLSLAVVALAVIAPGYVLTFGAFGWTLDRALASLLASPVAQALRSVRERRASMLRALRGVVGMVTTTIGAATFALSYSALDDVLRLGDAIASASISVGEVTITLKAILLALGVALATWLVTRVVRFILDHELLPRLNLRTGVPVAISTIVGYVLVVTGFVLATAALGIDLTKVTLLAGALGVGVGFGLQNVVNNFASGLILMLERPINVGDQIDVGGVVGEVKRIGVRSSTIRTFQGAEVIVPNSDLAGKQVTNWTLSDRARRYEIDVGVAYGSNPAQVLRLLEAAAASVPEVQKTPQPRALFTGFGASSLDFRLYAWVESLDVGLQAQNNLRMAVLGALGDAGIEIPFPQQELRIRHSGAAAEAIAAPRAVA